MLNLQDQITAKTQESEKLQLSFEDKTCLIEEMTNDPLTCFEDDITVSYDCLLNELYEDRINEIDFFSSSKPSELMKIYDNTMYRCGLNDYADGFDLAQFDEYTELCEELEELEDQIYDLEEEIRDLEVELEEEEEENI